MKVCPKCGGEWPDNANFCPKDGSQLVGMQPISPEDELVVEEPAGDLPQPEEPVGSDGLSESGEHDLDPREPAGFSETQWFMAAEDPDSLREDASTDDLYEMQDDYDWDEEIPEDVRSKFSLRRKKKKEEKEED